MKHKTKTKTKISTLIILLFITGIVFPQMNMTPGKFVNTENGYEINVPKAFKKLVGHDRKFFIRKHKFILNQKFDPYEDIVIFRDVDRILIIKSYSEIKKVKKHALLENAKQFEKLFNEKMQKDKQEYRLFYSSATEKKSGNQTFYIFKGNGNYYIKDCVFIQAITYYEKDRTFIIYGILKKADEKYLDDVFMSSILSFKPRKKSETGIFSVYPFNKKWFRYLLLFAVAVAVTVLYNKYTKRGEPVIGRKDK